MSSFELNCDVEALGEILKRQGLKIYFIGILGSGMKPLANLAHSLGYRIGGSDARAASLSDALFEKMSVKSVTDAELVVYSFAIASDDPEILLSLSLGIPTVSRAELLGALMRPYRQRVGVSGSHGKSTTSAAIDAIFSHAGVPTTSVIGATLFDGSDVRVSAADSFVYEACEYRDAFLHFYPTLSVITGIELDHTDYFRSLSHVTDSFYRAAMRSEDAVLLNFDSPVCVDMAGRLIGKRVYSYGRCEGAFYRYVRHSADSFSVLKGTEELVKIKMRLIGEYNMSNLTAAIAAADVSGIPTLKIREAAESFGGIERRMQRLCLLDGREVIYDYAHHPSEISVAIDTVKETYGECTVIFRPHTYSRTKALWGEFKAALSKAEFTILVDIYPAREEAIEGITSERLAKEMERAVYLPFSSAAEYARRHTVGAIVIMGAGDVDIIKDEILSMAKEI